MSFEKNKYGVVRNFLTPDVCDVLYEYVKFCAKRCSWVANNISTEYRKGRYGSLGDGQVENNYSNYGDVMFESILASSTPKIEKLIHKKILPTYTYHRLYETGSDLKVHKDRPSCQLSTTICLGYENYSVNENYCWPIYMGGKAVHLKKGDMVIYSGCEIEHWRESFEGKTQAQLFMHYVYADGQYKNFIYDERPMLGLPQEFKKLIR